MSRKQKQRQEIERNQRRFEQYEAKERELLEARADAEEAERLLRLACWKLLSGADDDTPNPSLAELRKNQSPELADISLAIQAHVRDLRNRLHRAPILSKYHGQRGFELERFIKDYEAWNNG